MHCFGGPCSDESLISSKVIFALFLCQKGHLKNALRGSRKGKCPKMTYELSIVRLATVKTPFENEQGMPGTIRYFFLPVDVFSAKWIEHFFS